MLQNRIVRELRESNRQLRESNQLLREEVRVLKSSNRKLKHKLKRLRTKSVFRVVRNEMKIARLNVLVNQLALEVAAMKKERVKRSRFLSSSSEETDLSMDVKLPTNHRSSSGMNTGMTSHLC